MLWITERTIPPELPLHALLDPTNIRLEKGNSNQNVPNRLVMAAVISSPWRLHGAWGYLANDFELAPAFSTQTGLPYSVGISGSVQHAHRHPGCACPEDRQYRIL